MEEIAEDLYVAMLTPLKRKLLASSKIKFTWKKTDPKIIMEEMESLPPSTPLGCRVSAV